MLEKANNVVAVDYNKTSKSLDTLIKKYDNTVKSIKEQEKAITSLTKSMNGLSQSKDLDVLNSKLEKTKSTANGLKDSIFGVLSPFSIEIDGTTNKFGTFTSGVESIINTFVDLAKGSVSTMTNLMALGAVLGEISGAFALVSLFASNLDENAASNITAIFEGLSGVIAAIVPLLTSFQQSGLKLGEVAGLLAIVLVGLFAAFSLISLVASKIGTSGLDAVAQLFTGIGMAIAPLALLFEVFKTSGMSLGEAIGLLLIVFGGLLAFLVLLTVAIKNIDIAAILTICVALGALALVLESVAMLFVAFGESGFSLGEILILLGCTFVLILGFLESLILIARQLVNDPKLLTGLLALVLAISVVMEVLAITIPIILDALGRFISTIAPFIITMLSTIGEILTGIIYALGTILPPIIESVGGLFSNIFKGIKGVIESVGTVLINILNTLKNLVTTVLDSILNFINKLGPAINNFVDNAISAVTKLINFIISGIEYLINTLLVDSINGLIKGINKVSEIVGFEFKLLPKVSINRFVPRLATGAVIPPRHEFLAVLGDQKHGTNIEAPLETIKQANREVLREFGGINNKEIVLKNLTLITQFGNKEFKKMVLDSIRLSEKEIGKPLLLS